MATSNIDQQDPMAELEDLLDEEPDGATMSLVEHLEELRQRIFKSLIGIVLGAIVAFIFRVQIMNFLTLPLPKEAADVLGVGTNHKLVITGIGENFTVFLKISIAVGILAAIPIILYQIWDFVSPGLYPKEKKTALP